MTRMEVLQSLEEMLAMLYCMAIMRLVNCVIEKNRKKNEISIGEAADAIGIPRMLIDIRYGLSMGVLNLAIVVPQVIVSVGAGPRDQLFGGGNSPALVLVAIAAFIGGIIAILAIPRTRLDKPRILHH